MTDIKTIVKNQREFFLTGQTRNENFRIRNLEKLKDLLTKYKDQLILALKEDLSKSSSESRLTEIGPLYEELNHTLKNLKERMKPERVNTPTKALPGRSYIVYEPLGVTLIISPWNYPVNLSIDPLIAAISSGNTAILKLSRKTKNTTSVIKNMINDNFPSDYIYVVDNEETSHKALLEEKYDHIFFTGSQEVGKEIMTKAASNLTKVTLELGGKSPCIVDESADLKISARRIMWGKLLNSGQTCVTPDYLLVHKDVKKELMSELRSAALEFFGTNPLDNPDYPKIIDEKAFIRLTSLLQGQDIYFGGNYDAKKQKIEPTIVDKVGRDNKLMEREIFGPILPVLEYQDIFALINKLKSLDKPLALYFFSQDESHIDRVMNDLSFGSGSINDTVLQISSPFLEFGGVGESGMGGYHGKYGFMNFSNRKAILDKSLNMDIKLRYPPYSKGAENIIKTFEK
jgi:aldehyde dehydrogenase (NAD+)